MSHITLLATCHVAYSGVWGAVFQNKPKNMRGGDNSP